MGPTAFGRGLPSLKNTEKGAPGGFFLTSKSNMHKIHFRLGELTTLLQTW